MRERFIDPWLLLAGWSACGAALALRPVVCLVAIGVVSTLLWWRGVSRVLLAAAGVLLLLHGWRANQRLIEAQQRYDAALSVLSEPRRCFLEARVVASPVVLRAGARSPPGHAARIDVAISSSRCDEDRGEALALPPGLRARLYGAPESLRRGDVIEAIATLAPVRLFHNPAQIDPRVRLALTGQVASGSALSVTLLRRARSLGAWVDAARAHVRRRITASYPPATEAFARALVLGETDLVDGEREAFRISGLSHLLAVSGTHLVIAVVALGTLLRAVLARLSRLAGRVDVGRIAAACCAVAAWVYADFAGGGGSAYRAAAMLSFAMVARAAGRRPSVERCFAWSILAGVIVQPLAPFDLSFALSLAATAGLLSIRAPLDVAARSRAWLLTVGAAWATSAAMLACAPIVLTVGPDLPCLGVAANLIAAPLGELVALPVALLHALSWWWPAAERGLALFASGSLWCVRAVAHAAADTPWGALALPPPDAWQLATLGGAATVWRVCAQRQRSVLLLLSLVVFIGLEWRLRELGTPHGELRVTVLDVGQGDAVLVDLPDGRLMMIDGGGLVGSPTDVWRRVIRPELRWRRRAAIDVLLLSHPHPDHYGGLLRALEEHPVGELWTSGLALASDGPARARTPDAGLAAAFGRAAARGVVLRTADELCDEHHDFGGARLRLLAPCPSFDPSWSANDNSLVVHIRHGRHAVLLAGDAEAAAEARLLRDRPALAADLLKVGHHGSRTSSGVDFVAAVSPRHAVISCGVRNRFGHPHAVTLRTLQHLGVRIWRTDQAGAFVWQTDGESVQSGSNDRLVPDDGG